MVLYEMANVSKRDTGLPYDLWIDSRGAKRNIQHNTPRIKVEINEEEMIPVSISLNPKILVDKEIPKFNKVKRYIIKYFPTLINHWNNKITDKQALNLLGKLDEE